MLRSVSRFSSSYRAYSRMMSGRALVVGEFDEAGNLSSSTLSAVTAAKQLGDVTVLIGGSSDSASKAAEAASKVSNVNEVLHAKNDKLDHGVAEHMSAMVKSVAGDYTHVLAASTAFGKNFLPRLGASLDVQPVTDVVEIKDDKTFVRPIFAGNAMSTVESQDSVRLLTVRPTAFEKADPEGGSAKVTEVAAVVDEATSTEWVGQDLTKSDRPELTSANVVVSGGRALKSAENFKIIYDLADKLGAAVGASRAAVDAGYVPNDLQVGQTGKVVAPSVYFAIGISGAVQHVAGMKDSKTIVAINKDPEAPIFQLADYGLVADLFKAVPEMQEKL